MVVLGVVLELVEAVASENPRNFGYESFKCFLNLLIKKGLDFGFQTFGAGSREETSHRIRI